MRKFGDVLVISNLHTSSYANSVILEQYLKLIYVKRGLWGVNLDFGAGDVDYVAIARIPARGTDSGTIAQIAAREHRFPCVTGDCITPFIFKSNK